MTQTKNNENPDHPRLEVGEEPEDFTKIVKTESGHLALVDASILRNSDHPAAAQAVIFATKQTPGEEVAFKITGEYDDAILRTLTMVPADLEEVQEHEQQKADKEGPEQSKEKMQQEEAQLDPSHDTPASTILEIQFGGHEGSKVKKLIDRKGRLAKAGNPASRQNRNAQNSVGRKKPSHDPAADIQARVVEAGSLKGARRGGYGQPGSQRPDKKKKKKKKVKRSKKVQTPQTPQTLSNSTEAQFESVTSHTQAMEVESFIKHINGNTITVEFLDGMEHSVQIHEGLCKLRREIVEGKIKGNLGLVHRACSVLDEHRIKRIPEDMKLIENLLRAGLPLV